MNPHDVFEIALQAYGMVILCDMTTYLRVIDWITTDYPYLQFPTERLRLNNHLVWPDANLPPCSVKLIPEQDFEILMRDIHVSA